MNILETINLANGYFIQSMDEEKLAAQTNELINIMKDPVISPENKTNALSLFYRIQLKRLLINYCETFSEKDYERYLLYMQESLEIVKSKDYKNTIIAYENAIINIKAINDVMKDYNTYYHMISGTSDNRLTKDIGECNKVIEWCKKNNEKIVKYQEVPVFTDGVKFTSLKESAINKLNSLIVLSQKFIEEIKVCEAEQFVKTNSTTIETIYPSKVSYYPNLDLKKDGLSNCMIISTPIIEEAYLFIKGLSIDNKWNMSVIDSVIFNNKSKTEIETILNYFTNKYLFITNMSMYHNENFHDLLMTIMKVAKNNKRIFIHDFLGNRAIYNDCLEIIEEDPILTDLDISTMFLPFPSFNDVIELLVSLKMINSNTDERVEIIKKKMPFMGYVGLNKIIESYGKHESWIDTGIMYHKKNNTQVIYTYLDNIVSQGMLISLEWGEFVIKQDDDSDKNKDFDYDNLYHVNPKNIKKIIDSGFSLTQKIGLACRYIMLAGNDDSKWKEIKIEEKIERIDTALKVIYFLFDINIKPKAELMTSDEFWGLCCDGGKLMKFEKKLVESDPHNTIEVICHECRHSFQHKCMDTPYQKWYFTEFGVTKGLVEEWRYNNQNYIQPNVSQVGYRCQGMEIDARAFQKDATQYLENCWNNIDFE